VQNVSQKQRSDLNHQKSDSIQICTNRQSGLIKIDTNQTKLESNQSNLDEGGYDSMDCDSNQHTKKQHQKKTIIRVKVF